MDEELRFRLSQQLHVPFITHFLKVTTIEGILKDSVTDEGVGGVRPYYPKIVFGIEL